MQTRKNMGASYSGTSPHVQQVRHLSQRGQCAITGLVVKHERHRLQVQAALSNWQM
jgi:hypothetical protein